MKARDCGYVKGKCRSRRKVNLTFDEESVEVNERKFKGEVSI